MLAGGARLAKVDLAGLGEWGRGRKKVEVNPRLIRAAGVCGDRRAGAASFAGEGAQALRKRGRGRGAPQRAGGSKGCKTAAPGAGGAGGGRTSKGRGLPSMSTPLPLDSMDTCWMWGASLDRAWGVGREGEESVLRGGLHGHLLDVGRQLGQSRREGKVAGREGERRAAQNGTEPA